MDAKSAEGLDSERRNSESPSFGERLSVISEQECTLSQEEKLQPPCLDENNEVSEEQSLMLTAFASQKGYPYVRNRWTLIRKSTLTTRSGSETAIVESSQPQIYLFDANTIANLKAGSQYALVPIKDEKSQIECFANHQEGITSGTEKDKQVWSTACSSSQKQHQHLAILKAEAAGSNSTHNHNNDPIKVVQVETEHIVKENAIEAPTSLMTTSSIGSRLIDHNEKTIDISVQQSSDDVIKNVTFATLNPLCQIQPYGQQRTPCFETSRFQYSQRPSSEMCCPISTSTPHQLHPISSGCISQDSTPNAHTINRPRSTPTGWHPTSTWPPFHNVDPIHHGRNVTTTPTGMHSTPTTTVSLNSSGEEVEAISPDYPRVPHNTPNSCEVARMSIATLNPVPQMIGPLDNVPYYLPFNGRENHNEKERKRRNRIKNACQTLRTLVPGLSDKTDKATVFEFTVQYLMHLKRHVGNSHDKEFMQKYSPY